MFNLPLALKARQTVLQGSLVIPDKQIIIKSGTAPASTHFEPNKNGTYKVASKDCMLIINIITEDTDLIQVSKLFKLKSDGNLEQISL